MVATNRGPPNQRCHASVAGASSLGEVGRTSTSPESNSTPRSRDRAPHHLEACSWGHYLASSDAGDRVLSREVAVAVDIVFETHSLTTDNEAGWPPAGWTGSCRSTVGSWPQSLAGVAAT